MAGIINPGMDGILECLSQKLATSLGSKQQGPGPQSLAKTCQRVKAKPGGLGFKTVFCHFQRTEGKVENSARKPPQGLYH